jgi:hypothetical protein
MRVPSSFTSLLAGVVLAAAVALRAAAPPPPAVVTDTRTWIPDTHAAQPAVKGSALDMSSLLDAPAGTHGFVTVKGDRFVFEDGTPARFWGGNFFGEANFPDRADAERLADIVARSGANIVRMHHLDVVAPWTDKVVSRSLFGGQQPHTTRRLDPAMLDRFEYLVSCLKTRGVYVYLSPVSSRMVRPGDGFPGPAEAVGDIGLGLKFEGMFDDALIDLQREYLRQLLTHVNPYTGLPLVNDPVMAMTEVINENTTIWPQPDGDFAVKSDYYRSMLRRQFNQWLRAMVGGRDALERRWSADGRTGLAAGEDPGADSVEIPPTYRDRQAHGFSDARVTDTFRFLADLQQRYFALMRQFFRTLGLRAPLAGSNHWVHDPIDLRQNANFDYVDRHQYWTHPEGSYNYEAGQTIVAKPMVKEDDGGALALLARRRVAGLPYTVSEWHHCLPNPYRAEGPLLMAAYSALQGWHPMQYAYWATSETRPAMINAFEGMFDPSQTATLPAAALLFLRGDAAEATEAVYDRITPEQASSPLAAVTTHPAAVLVAKYGIAFTDRPEVPSAPLPPSVASPTGVFRSSTGELSWNAPDGVVTIDTPRTQAVVGFSGGRRLATAAVVFEISTPFAVVAVSSLTKDPIAASARLLVSTSADSRWTGTHVSPDGQRVLTTGRFPFLMQPVEGRVTIDGAPATVYRLDTDGTRLGTVRVTHGPRGVVLPLAASARAMHYEVVRR